MKDQLPYVCWFHGDFLRSTAAWTLTERATYWMLLCAQWESGPLPVSEDRMALIVGLPVSQFSDIWRETVGRKFIETPAGYINERMEAHKQKVEAYRQKLSESGRKGMQSRWGKKSNVVDFPKGGEP